VDCNIQAHYSLILAFERMTVTSKISSNMDFKHRGKHILPRLVYALLDDNVIYGFNSRRLCV
jgi:hypothetical protein